MRSSLHYALIALLAFALVCASPATGQAQRRSVEGSFDRTLTVGNTVDLDVATGSGSIDIRQGSSGRVEIHGKVRSGTDWFRSDRDAEDIVREIEANPPIEQVGNTIRVGRERDRSWNNVSISYEIVIPAQGSVRSNSGSGRISVAGLSGSLETSTGSGSITITGLRGELSAHTGSGSITVDGEQTGRWNLETGSGSVNIRLPQNAGFDLNAHTGSGGVYGDFPITIQGRIERRPHDLSGKVRGGGHALDVRTGSGSIRIE